MSLKKVKMNTVFYIIVTVIFSLFVIYMGWWLFKYVRKDTVRDVTDLKKEDLSDDQKQLISKFCREMRLSRLSKLSTLNKKV